MKSKVCLTTILTIILLTSGLAFAEAVPATDAELTIIGAQDDMIGSVLASGDFNGDHVPDLFIGAPGG